MSQEQIHVETRKADDVLRPTNHWFVLRLLGFILILGTNVFWVSQGAIGKKTISQ